MELSKEEEELIIKMRNIILEKKEKHNKYMRDNGYKWKEKASERKKEKYANLSKEELQKHKDKCKERTDRTFEERKQFRQDNKEKINEYNKEYRKTPSYKKSYCITNWKKNGVICENDDYSSLYDRYLNCENCEECGVELQTGNAVKNKRCLDHDHKTGLFRNIICNSCNVKRGNNDRKLN